MALRCFLRRTLQHSPIVSSNNFLCNRGLRGSRTLEPDNLAPSAEADQKPNDGLNEERIEIPDSPDVSDLPDQQMSGGRRRKPLRKLLQNAATYSYDEPPLEQLIDPFISGPYVKGTTVPSDVKQADQLVEEPIARIDPRSMSVIQFPGDGCQFVGMCGDPHNFPPHIRVMYEIASDILGYDLLDLTYNGPEAKLNMTRYSQPAILVASLAALENLRDVDPQAVENCVVTAGFSIGEVAALVFSGVLTFEEGVQYAKYRGEAMQLAGEITPGGLSLVLYSADSQLGKATAYAEEWCRKEHRIDHPVCSTAYYMFPHCKIIGGNVEALKFVEMNAKDFRLKKVKRLPAAAAYHTELMRPAAEPLRAYLKTLELKEPKIKIYSSTTGQRFVHPKQIIKTLPSSVHTCVRWEQLLHAIYARKTELAFPFTYECGPGHTLGPILKLVNRKAHIQYNCIQPYEIPSAAKAEM